MLINGKTIKEIFVIIVINALLINTIVIVALTSFDLGLLAESEDVHIDGFSLFQLGDDHENITSIKTDDWLYFENNNSLDPQVYEDYKLAFDTYGDVIDITIDF